MALRLIQIMLPGAEYDSIFEMIEDQKIVTTWPDPRAPGQLILQLGVAGFFHVLSTFLKVGEFKIN